MTRYHMVTDAMQGRKQAANNSTQLLKILSQLNLNISDKPRTEILMGLPIRINWLPRSVNVCVNCKC